MSDELKPCPFCGGEGSYGSPHFQYQIGCEDSACHGFLGYANICGSKAVAIERWNRRSDIYELGEAIHGAMEKSDNKKQTAYLLMNLIIESTNSKEVTSAIAAALEVASAISEARGGGE